MYGSNYYSKGIYTAWRPGYFYLTNRRLILYRQDFNEITFQVPLEEIKALLMREEVYFVKEKKRQILYLMDKQNQVHRFSAVETNQLKEAIEQKLAMINISLDANPVFPAFEEAPIDFLTEEEEVTHRGRKIWYLVPASGILQETWRPGHLYLTNNRLCWWYDFEKKLVFDIPVNTICSTNTEMKNTSGLSRTKELVLEVTYSFGSAKSVAAFAGEEQIEEWTEALNRIVSGKISEKIETCPQCGKSASTKELLENGCLNCGWVSHKSKKKIVEAAL